MDYLLLKKYPTDHFVTLTPHEQLIQSYIIYCTVKVFYQGFMELCGRLKIPCGARGEALIKKYAIY